MTVLDVFFFSSIFFFLLSQLLRWMKDFTCERVKRYWVLFENCCFSQRNWEKERNSQQILSLLWEQRLLVQKCRNQENCRKPLKSHGKQFFLHSFQSRSLSNIKYGLWHKKRINIEIFLFCRLSKAIMILCIQSRS